MKIAQVAPLAESCPPREYGGTERVVSYLTEELVARGHQVVLFASGDSVTRAKLIPPTPKALRKADGKVDQLAYMTIQLAQVLRSASRFDVIHFHWDYLHFPVFSGTRQPTVTTFHGRLDLPHFAPLTGAFPTMPLVSISDAQRRPIPHANWYETIYHGLPMDLLPYGDGDGGYLAFIGRISPEKRVDRAIEIARRVGLPLRIGAKVDAADRSYFEDQIRPLIERSPFVEFIGEVDDRGKAELLGGASAMLFPIDWPEPFGLVMIEAMATGTPVVAFNHGSVPEVLESGRTGYIVDNMDDAVAATRAAIGLDRRAVRAAFEERFSVRRMVDDYVDLYERLVAESVPSLAIGGQA